ncbi:hypothetical protein FRC06_004777 [Ceratobasidium sp. 370]|nr:hypothetical protein FRC06_004777 [Ceratobasidium sp. 370]
MTHAASTSPTCHTRGLRAIGFLASVEDDLHNKVFLIYNKKHGTGVKVDRDADGEALKGSITTEENIDGRKWRFERCDSPGLNWYKICPVGYPGKFASPDSTPGDDQGIHISKTETWWMLEPVADMTYCYKISDIEKQLCWRQESKQAGTPVKLDKYVLDDSAVYWDFQIVHE